MTGRRRILDLSAESLLYSAAARLISGFGRVLMNNNLKVILDNKAINAWGLFSLVCIPMSVVIALELMATDL